MPLLFSSNSEAFELSEPYDLILSISCIEHVPTKQRLEKLIEHFQAATTPEGVHCFMMTTNNEWINSASDEKLTPLIEQNLTSTETVEMLERLYDGWKIHGRRVSSGTKLSMTSLKKLT